jgi:hypothetical protein
MAVVVQRNSALAGEIAEAVVAKRVQSNLKTLSTLSRR